ncbi:hypothetical protein BDQ17DRAFT_1416421 [Cyathus striatus]|nr:hypothetical protein BDQ17DRAFT_1416421 [Cyathus striatus]
MTQLPRLKHTIGIKVTITFKERKVVLGYLRYSLQPSSLPVTKEFKLRLSFKVVTAVSGRFSGVPAPNQQAYQQIQRALGTVVARLLCKFMICLHEVVGSVRSGDVRLALWSHPKGSISKEESYRNTTKPTYYIVVYPRKPIILQKIYLSWYTHSTLVLQETAKIKIPLDGDIHLLSGDYNIAHARYNMGAGRYLEIARMSCGSKSLCRRTYKFQQIGGSKTKIVNLRPRYESHTI